jgi:type IV secretion system protein VirB5
MAGRRRLKPWARGKEETMRNVIRKSALALAICGAVSGLAHAQLVVIDPSNLAQAVEQVTQLVQQLKVLQEQYAQLQATYAAIAHAPQGQLNQLGAQLNVDQYRNALPTQSSTLGAVMNGTGQGTGNLASSTQNYLGQNRVYAPTGTDFQAQEMQRRATSVAGSQAMAAELYQSASNRITTLRAIEAQLANAPDAKAVADIQARLLAEQTYIQAQQVQAQSLAMWQASQQRNEEQRRDEDRRREIDRLIDKIKAQRAQAGG